MSADRTAVDHLSRCLTSAKSYAALREQVRTSSLFGRCNPAICSHAYRGFLEAAKTQACKKILLDLARLTNWRVVVGYAMSVILYMTRCEHYLCAAWRLGGLAAWQLGLLESVYDNEIIITEMMMSLWCVVRTTTKVSNLNMWHELRASTSKYECESLTNLS